jgi:hypothetical protein
VDIFPLDVHGLLFAKPAHEIEVVLRAVIERAGRVECQQLVVFIDLDLLIDEARAVVLADEFRHALRSKESEQLGELVVHGAGREFLLIAQENDEAQKILSLDVFDVGLRAALREIAEGEAISQPGLPLTGELNVLEKIRLGRAQAHAGTLFDGIGDDQSSRNRIELRLLLLQAVVGGSRIGSDCHASALTVFGPVEVIGAFGVLFLPLIDFDPIGLDAAVGGEDDPAETPAIGGVDTLGDIHIHGALPCEFRIQVRIPTL